AASGVMAFEPWPIVVHLFSRGPAIGMPLFFVLSGFVIHYNYANSFRSGFVSPTIDFFIARFARLYPLYILMLVLYVVNQRLVPGIVSGETDLSFLPRYLLLWQAWSIEYRGTTWLGVILLPPAWSISVEVFFYMLYPLLAGALLRLRAMSKLLAVLALIVFGYYLAVVLGYIYFDELRVWGNEAFHINADPKNALLGWIFNTGPVGRVWAVLLGALLAR